MQIQPPTALPDGYRLTKTLQKEIARHRDPNDMQGRRNFAMQMAEERNQAIARWYTQGGESFIAWVKAHYKRWSGEPLHWNEPYQEEFYLLIGNPWIERVIVEKSAQVGFSEMLIALSAFILTEIKVPAGFGFEAERKLRDMVPRLQASFDHCLPLQEARRKRRAATGRKDTDHKERKISIGGVECTFFYTSTATKAKGGQRQASSAMSSFTAWVMMGDEIELWGPGTLDVATERQSACEMPTKPFRAGSTPGHEGGIVDTEVRNSGHLFQWQFTCPHCQTQQFLEPFGNLLKAVKVAGEEGQEEDRYVDVTGRPLDWFAHDSSSRDRKIDTAHVGCQQCGGELTLATLAAGQFACRNTGVSLREVCDRTTRTQTPIFKTVAIRLPRLASTLFKAPERIRKLLTTRNPTDQIQQGLGLAITIGTGRIALPRLQRCVGLPLPATRTTPDLVVMGVDQGRAHNWGMVQNWYLGTEGDWEQRWLEAHVEIVWHGEVVGFDGIDTIARHYRVDLVGIDNEPEVQLAAAHARKHLPRHAKTLLRDRQQGKKEYSVFLFDQVVLKGEDFRRGTRKIQGDEVPVYALHRTFGLDAVRDRIYRNLQHFPAGLDYNPNDEGNLLYHYLTSDRRTDGTWSEVPGTPDHFFHCDNFCEAAVLVSGYEPEAPRIMFASLEKQR